MNLYAFDTLTLVPRNHFWIMKVYFSSTLSLDVWDRLFHILKDFCSNGNVQHSTRLQKMGDARNGWICKPFLNLTLVYEVVTNWEHLRHFRVRNQHSLCLRSIHSVLRLPHQHFQSHWSGMVYRGLIQHFQISENRSLRLIIEQYGGLQRIRVCWKYPCRESK